MQTAPEDYYAALVRQRNEALDRLANAEAELAAATRAIADLTGRLDAVTRQARALAEKTGVKSGACCSGAHDPA